MEHEKNSEPLSDDDKEYAQFVRNLLDHSIDEGSVLWDSVIDDDDDDEYQEEDEDDEEDDEEETEGMDGDSTSDAASVKSLPSLDEFALDPNALEEELGGLLEEDMEAAINSLIMKEMEHPIVAKVTGGPSATTATNDPQDTDSLDQQGATIEASDEKPTANISPVRLGGASSIVSRKTLAPIHAQPTQQQVLQLQKLMSHHYQLLVQQAVLTCRAAHSNRFKSTKRKRIPDYFFGGETAEDLKEILDGTVTMLQDLDRNRKDAMRFSIQMNRAKRHHAFFSSFQQGFYPVDAPNSLKDALNPNPLKVNGDDGYHNNPEEQKGWLTRSAFSRTLRESDGALDYSTTQHMTMVDQTISNRIFSSNNQNSNSTFGSNTVFGVRGLARLNETFQAIDNSLNQQNNANRSLDHIYTTSITLKCPQVADDVNIFYDGDHGAACEALLQHAKADYDKQLIPGCKELSHILTYPYEVMGNETGMPMSEEQQKSLRMNKQQFTAAEDNLLLRGVNLYGEKEWSLISDRFLPDRTISQVSQRYWRLCFLIYKSNGIFIDSKGNFLEPNRSINGPEDFDEDKVKAILKEVRKPDVIGLYRWSMEEDLCLLKAVPVMGRFFAEIGKRFIPYRDRGALRKRYQVLERRVKGEVKRDKKLTADLMKKNKSSRNSNKNKRVDSSSNSKQTVAPSLAASSNMDGLILGTRYIPVNNSKPEVSSVKSASENIQKQNVNQSNSTKTKSTQSLVQSFPKTARVSSSAIPRLNPFSKQRPNFTQTYQPFMSFPQSYTTTPRFFPNDSNVVGTDLHANSAAIKDTSCSRAEFERIIEGEWSQMSGVGKIIDEGTFQKASTPSKAGASLLPQIHYSENSFSGLSVLVDDSKYAPPISATHSVSRGGNIMASVLKRANQGLLSERVSRNDTTSNERPDCNGNSHFSDGFGIPLPTEQSRQAYGHGQLYPHSLMDNTDMVAAAALNKMMAPHDLEAVSALSQLSASKDQLELQDTSFAIPIDLKEASFTVPTSPFQPPPSQNATRRVENDVQQPPVGTGARRSLFEKVVGSKK